MLNLSKFPKGVLQEILSERRDTSCWLELSICSSSLSLAAAGMWTVVIAAASSVVLGGRGTSGPNMFDPVWKPGCGSCCMCPDTQCVVTGSSHSPVTE